MSNVRSIRDAKTVSRQASEWLVLLESGEATAGDRARFDAWRREHPANQAAFDELSYTWSRLNAMGERVRGDGIADPDPDVVDKYLARSQTGSRRGKRSGWSAVAASLAVVIGGIILFLAQSSVLYSTAVGEQTTITLSDRSTIQLNTDTELHVAYTDTVRNIEMRRGEAYFDVAHDGERPFVVKAGHGAIRAVGTGFVVQMKSTNLVAVTVTEGAVEVTQDTQAGADTVRRDTMGNDPPVPTLTEGHRVEYGRNIGRPVEVPAEELNRHLAWRQGMLIFDGQTLEEVVREVGRYTDTRLIISDDEVGQLRIGGAFRAGDIDGLLEILEKGFNITVDRDGRRTVYIAAGHKAATG